MLFFLLPFRTTHGPQGLQAQLCNAGATRRCIALGKPCSQGQATDIMIRAKEIDRMKQLLVGLYTKHTHKPADVVGECVSVSRQAKHISELDYTTPGRRALLMLSQRQSTTQQ